MINYELAKELKDKGFPQPEPTIGQMWFILEKKLLSSLSRKVLVGTHDFEDVRHLHIIYCPTFEEIYAELPELFTDPKVFANPHFLNINKGRMCYCDKENFILFLINEVSIFVDIDKGDIATAAAKLWLKLKEQNLLTN